MSFSTIRIFIAAAAALIGLGISVPARADEPQPIQDSVSMELRAETWVSTSRALVQVNIIAAGDAAGAATVRTDILKALEGLVKDEKAAEWRPVSLNRGTDEAGLERWYALYEARIPETLLSGLSEKAKAASRAGLQISVSSVSFTPEMAEIESARAKMREDLYKLAQEELTRLNAAIAGRNYRIAAVSFSGGMMPQAPMNHMYMAKRGGMATAEMAMASDGSMGASSDMSVETRMEQTAYVTFSASLENKKSE